MMKNYRRQKIIILGLITIGTILAFGQPSTAQAQIRPLADIQNQYSNIDNLGYDQILNNSNRTGALYDLQAQMEARRLANTPEAILEIPALIDLQKDIIDKAIIKFPEHQQELERARAIIEQKSPTNAQIQSAAAASEGCKWYWPFSKACVVGVINTAGQIFKQIFIFILWLVGIFFDYSVKFSIANFSDLVGGADGAVNMAWKVLRDVANLFFIFILLYIAIGMILQLPRMGDKRLLANVIIIALLINFSAFFARVVIDASNVTAYQFYKAITDDTARLGVSSASFQIKGISATFMNALSLPSEIAKNRGDPGFNDSILGSGVSAFAVVIMILVAIFVFLTAAILFVVRTVTLLLLIILSPLAFLMYAFPNQQGLFSKWWDTLLKQAFFAPLYLIMVYATILVLKSPALAGLLRSAQTTSWDATIANFIFYYLIAIGLMFGAIIIATKLGAKGASAAMKGAGALTGAATRAVSWSGKQGGRLAGGLGIGAAGLVAGKEKGAGIRQFATTQLKNITTDIDKVRKQSPITKGVKEFTKSPFKTTAEELAAVTKDYGISGILGRTKDEEAEARKKEKEANEATRRRQLQEYNDKLERMSEKDMAGAAEIMGKMKGKEIAGLKKKALLNPAVIFNYTEDDLVAMNREGVDTEIMGKIYEEIRKDPQHKAYNYVTKSPSRARRRGAPQPSAPDATTPTPTSSQSVPTTTSNTGSVQTPPAPQNPSINEMRRQLEERFDYDAKQVEGLSDEIVKERWEANEKNYRPGR